MVVDCVRGKWVMQNLSLTCSLSPAIIFDICCFSVYLYTNRGKNKFNFTNELESKINCVWRLFKQSDQSWRNISFYGHHHCWNNWNNHCWDSVGQPEEKTITAYAIWLVSKGLGFQVWPLFTWRLLDRLDNGNPFATTTVVAQRLHGSCCSKLINTTVSSTSNCCSSKVRSLSLKRIYLVWCIF